MTEKVDLFESLFGKLQSGFPSFREFAVRYIKEEWIKVMGLALSATQTFVMVHYFAPEWAWWLPYVAIVLLEGGVPYWQWREEEADMADGSVEDSKRNEQEKIANAMIWICLLLIGVTVMAGVFIEVTESRLSEILVINPSLMNVFGWTSLTGIFTLVVLHVFADWRYKRADPVLMIERDSRQKERAIDKERRLALANGRLDIAKREAKFIEQKLRRGANRTAWDRANLAVSDEMAAKPKKRVRKQRAQ